MDEHHAAAALNLHFTQFGVVAAAGLIPHNYLQQQPPLQLQQQHVLQQQQQQVRIKLCWNGPEILLKTTQDIIEIGFLFIWFNNTIYFTTIGKAL